MQLVDFDAPDNNDFLAVNQLVVREGNHKSDWDTAHLLLIRFSKGVHFNDRAGTGFARVSVECPHCTADRMLAGCSLRVLGAGEDFKPIGFAKQFRITRFQGVVAHAIDLGEPSCEEGIRLREFAIAIMSMSHCRIR